MKRDGCKMKIIDLSLGMREWGEGPLFYNYGDGIHSSVLAWRIPWTEQPAGLQSTGPHRVGHD